MEISSRPQERDSLSTSPLPSPKPRSDNNNNNTQNQNNSNSNSPYPTTFVQADTSTFKQVVQMLTGSATSSPPDPSQINSSTHTNHNSNNKPPNHHYSIPPIRQPVKKQGFKLYERRNSLKNGLMISPMGPNNCLLSPRQQQEILSPSMLNFPSLVLSPVTPLIEDPFDRREGEKKKEEEERAMAEKGFYLHPSPRTATAAAAEPPQLLALFPVTSPRVSESYSSN